MTSSKYISVSDILLLSVLKIIKGLIVTKSQKVAGLRLCFAEFLKT